MTTKNFDVIITLIVIAICKKITFSGTHLCMSLFCPSVRLSACLSVSGAPYLRNRTLSDHNFWCTCVK